MKEKELLKRALCAYLPWKLKLKSINDGSINTMVGIGPTVVDLKGCVTTFPIELFKPIFRPWSSLTEYQNDLGLTPLIHLAEMYLPIERELGEFYTANGYVMTYGGITFGYNHEDGFYLSDPSYHGLINQLKMFEKLIEWHYNAYNLPENLVIYREQSLIKE
ncbi:MAG: hypothetical protein IH795_00795 [Bacteroidetes bacterium]|nr:hypothetical protein [Bacteroidota bacterium]